MLAKRLMDILLVVPGLLLLLPLFFALAVWIKLDSPGPVFFRQERIGRYGRPFCIFKFRTMVVDAEQLGMRITASDDPRITRSGRFLRATKLDELPQLINVLKGEMSLVGPRPEVAEYVAHYPEALREKVLSVPPGITDRASIEYRDESRLLGISANPQQTYINEILPIKLQYYAQYVDERNIWGDLVLILSTIVAIIRRG